MIYVFYGGFMITHYSVFITITRDFRKKGIDFPFKVHATIIMVQSIGNHKIFCPELKIVPRNLVKNALGNIYLRRFALDQNLDSTLRIKNDHIISFFYLVYQQLFFHIDMAKGIIPIL